MRVLHIPSFFALIATVLLTSGVLCAEESVPELRGVAKIGEKVLLYFVSATSESKWIEPGDSVDGYLAERYDSEAEVVILRKGETEVEVPMGDVRILPSGPAKAWPREVVLAYFRSSLRRPVQEVALDSELHEHLAETVRFPEGFSEMVGTFPADKLPPMLETLLTNSLDQIDVFVPSLGYPIKVGRITRSQLPVELSHNLTNSDLEEVSQIIAQRVAMGFAVRPPPVQVQAAAVAP